MLHLECKPDEVLARRLGRTRRQCLHHNDKGRVCKALQRSTGSVGMIDEDPGAAQPLYLAKLVVLSDDHRVRVLEDRSRQHRVVILRPRLEEWVIFTAEAVKINLEDFGLSHRGNTLHREINSRLVKFDEALQALLTAASPGLLHLRALIQP